MACKLGVAEARPFWAHRTQMQTFTPDDLPEAGVEYWADGPICGAFHVAPWPGVWMAHYGVKASGWGQLTYPARRVLQAFWDAHEPLRIIGWTDSRNRAALAFARRIGFEIDGTFPTKDGQVIMQGWANGH